MTMKTSITPTHSGQFLWNVTPRSTHPAVAHLLPYGTEPTCEKAEQSAKSYQQDVHKAMSTPKQKNGR